MRFLVLEDDRPTAKGLQSDLEPLGHVVSLAPTVPAAQVALQAEEFQVAVLSSRLLAAASYSLVDYIRITQPELRVIVVKDALSEPGALLSSDWVLDAPVSPLEVVQVTEYLLDQSAREGSKHSRRRFTYADAPRPASGHRNLMN